MMTAHAAGTASVRRMCGLVVPDVRFPNLKTLVGSGRDGIVPGDPGHGTKMMGDTVRERDSGVPPRDRVIDSLPGGIFWCRPV